MPRYLHVLACLLLVVTLGCFDPTALSETETAEPAAENPPGEPVADAEQAPPAEEPAAPKPAAKRWLINKVPWRIVDKNKAMAENPNYVVVQQVKADASDYFTAVSNAYVNAKTRIYLLNLRHDIDIQRAANDGKWPTFEEFQKALKRNQIELNEMFPYQVYAYDDQTGEIVILEDPVEKRRLRQEAGLPPE